MVWGRECERDEYSNWVKEEPGHAGDKGEKTEGWV